MTTTTASYERPDTLLDALACRARTGARVIAGCTDAFPVTERKIMPGDVIDITAIPDLRGLSMTDEGLKIGATTTWTDIANADLPPACAALQSAARLVGGRQIQNRGTIAGNLCNASPAADGVPALLILDAEVALASAAGVRRLPLSDFLTGPRQTALRSDEIMTAIHIPHAALTGQSQFDKLGAREYLVISIVMVAARIVIEKGRIADIACAVGSCGPVATRIRSVEQACLGREMHAVPDVLAQLKTVPDISPIADIRADAQYRVSSATELLRRCISDLVARQGAS